MSGIIDKVSKKIGNWIRQFRHAFKALMLMLK